jgi:hypothetical protein
LDNKEYLAKDTPQETKDILINKLKKEMCEKICEVVIEDAKNK